MLMIRAKLCRGCTFLLSSKKGSYHSNGSVSRALTTEAQQRVFESLDFPCKFTMKVIGVMDDSFVENILNDVVKILSATSSDAATDINHSITRKGKFASVTITPEFTSAEQIYDCYDVLKSDTRVKFVL